MDAKTLKDVSDWMRATDLAEVAWRRGGEGFELASEPPAAAPAAAFPGSALVPVPSPEVGLFRAAPKGKSAAAQPGEVVAAGALLGAVDTGAGEAPVTAPAAGKLLAGAAEDGKAVEYGQPLFFIAPR